MNAAGIRNKASAAVRHFWRSRDAQRRKQGRTSGRKDAGNRSAVTGGAQMDGFVRAICELIQEAGIPEKSIHWQMRQATHLPGFFRPAKSWDIVVVVDEHLLACIEFKSQVGSFGNNFNNRCEESVGSAHDFWTAYREGAFRASPRPWLGYLMLLEEAPGSTRPVQVYEPHFPVFNEFREASYAKRYELLCTRLVRERLYDAACLLLSDAETGPDGEFREPNAEVGFEPFARSLAAKASAFAS